MRCADLEVASPRRHGGPRGGGGGFVRVRAVGAARGVGQWGGRRVRRGEEERVRGKGARCGCGIMPGGRG